MRGTNHLASRFAVAAAVVLLAGTSAFAESRPTKETNGRGDSVRRERSSRDGVIQRRDTSQNDRGRTQGSSARPRVEDRSRNRGRNDQWRGDSRGNSDRGRTGNRGSIDNRGSVGSRGSVDNRGRNGSSDRGRYDNRQPYYARGRVNRINRYGSGYRVWIAGAPYPFFIPEAYYYRNRLRIGLMINLGGYYNPGGYYDYYDGYDRYDNSDRYDSSSVGSLRGVVESVDYRRDTFVLRNDATGSFVTVFSRDRRNVRAGDYVEVAGEWSRSGVFQALDVDLLDSSYQR